MIELLSSWLNDSFLLKKSKNLNIKVLFMFSEGHQNLCCISSYYKRLAWHRHVNKGSYSLSLVDRGLWRKQTRDMAVLRSILLCFRKHTITNQSSNLFRSVSNRSFQLMLVYRGSPLWRRFCSDYRNLLDKRRGSRRQGWITRSWGRS